MIYDLSDISKKIFANINFDKLYYLDIRKNLLIYLKDNNKLNNTEYEIEDIEDIKNIKFNMNNIDKFIQKYLIKI